MSLTDAVEQAAVRATLAESPLFAGLADSALDTLAASAQRVTIRGGEVLFSVGEPPDALYVVAAGRLYAELPNGKVAGNIGRLDPIGEIGVLSGEPRGATIIARRDSLLYRFSRESFNTFMLAHPAALLAISRVLIARLRQNAREAQLRNLRQHRSFAVWAGDLSVATGPVVGQLCRELAGLGRVARIDATFVDSALGPGTSATPCTVSEQDSRLLEWLSQLEASHDYLVYEVTGSAAWQQRALKQADRILVLGKAHQAPEGERIERLHTLKLKAAVDVVLQHPHGAHAAQAWRSACRAEAHYFLRPDRHADFASMARQLTGRGVGLVLGGGGARGFAHIGLLRALEEEKLPIDLVGGTSMGAFIAALHAMELDWRAVTQVVRDTFVKRNLLNDYMIPRVALIEGKKLSRRLTEVFGERQAETLLKPFFCVTTNLTSGTQMTHCDGPLATWVGTSMCIPGVAPPVAFRGDLLADGAVVNSLPTDVMQRLGRGPIIASDVSTEGGVAAPGVEGPDPDAVLRRDAKGKRVNILQILFRVSTLSSEAGVKSRARQADLYLRMPVGHIQTFDWKLLDQISESGYRHALERLPGERQRFTTAPR